MLTITTKVDGSQLVTKNNTEQVYTRNRKRAVRGALTLGLADYLRQLSFDAEEGGRKVSFANVFSDRAVWETGKPKFPSALAKTEGQFNYDAQSFSPAVVATIQLLEGKQGLYLLQSAECTGQVTVDCWATDPDERELLVTMLEDAAFPVEWMAGFRLDLPHYFGARAEYLLQSTVYLDTPEDAIQRYCKATLTFDARVPVLQVVKLGAAAVRLINNTEG